MAWNTSNNCKWSQSVLSRKYWTSPLQRRWNATKHREITEQLRVLCYNRRRTSICFTDSPAKIEVAKYLDHHYKHYYFNAKIDKEKDIIWRLRFIEIIEIFYMIKRRLRSQNLSRCPARNITPSYVSWR